ncbi:hypothetical protein [Pseudolabrys sp.]|uniref:hypothetical protein n=1 Tax=Pseudolabrys sp. TaxID=1960880 RepID=UPI003D0B126F
MAALAAFYYYAPRARVLNKDTLCPIQGPDGISVVLVDATDDLPDVAKRQAFQILDDLIISLPAYYKLDIRVLDIASMRSRSLFAKCNPGDGSGLSEWDSNPRAARQRWIENFRKPARAGIENSLGSAKAQSSPIMAALQDIAVGEFSSATAQKADKALTVISDMVEYTRDYNQYPRGGDLSYERFRRSPAYLKYRTDLHGAQLKIEYIQRVFMTEPYLKAHMQFWQQWMHDNGGSKFSAHRLQGVN